MFDNFRALLNGFQWSKIPKKLPKNMRTLRSISGNFDRPWRFLENVKARKLNFCTKMLM